MDHETKLILNEVAESAVRNVLTSIGVDVSDPIAAQEQFAALRELRQTFSDPDFAADMAHLRKWRKAVEEVESKGRIALIGMFLSGLAAMIWLGIQTKLGLPHGP